MLNKSCSSFFPGCIHTVIESERYLNDSSGSVITPDASLSSATIQPDHDHHTMDHDDIDIDSDSLIFPAGYPPHPRLQPRSRQPLESRKGPRGAEGRREDEGADRTGVGAGWVRDCESGEDEPGGE